jgi:hypothetical protein
MAVVAIDWSGAKDPRGKLWLAEAHDGHLHRVIAVESRDAAVEEVIRFCRVVRSARSDANRRRSLRGCL